jgi:nucleoside-diphosphate-sugar epimerase
MGVAMSDLEAGEVLVTGATGCIGRALCRALAERGVRVHALSRSGGRPPGAHSSSACDVAHADLLGRIVHALRPRVVFHLAGHATGSRLPSVVVSTFQSKLAGAVNLLLACQSLPDTRNVLAGSLEEPDASDPVPVSPYAAASAAAASYGALFHDLYGQAVLHARLFMVYGPGDPNEERLVPYTIRSLLAGASPALGVGERPVDWIYVDDVVRGLIALGADHSIRSGSFDLGTGVAHPIREVVLRIAGALGSTATIGFGARPEPERQRVRLADLAATRRRLDWAPAVSLDEGLARTIAWMRERPRTGLPAESRPQGKASPSLRA